MKFNHVLELGITYHESHSDGCGEDPTDFAYIVTEPITHYRVQTGVHKRTSTTLGMA